MLGIVGGWLVSGCVLGIAGCGWVVSVCQGLWVVSVSGIVGCGWVVSV